MMEGDDDTRSGETELFCIRRGKPEDAPGIARVHVHGWRWGYRGLIPDEILARLSVPDSETKWRTMIAAGDRDVLWVAEHEGVVVGVSAWGAARGSHDSRLTAELYALYQEPAVAGRGVAGRLLSATVADMRAAGHRGALLWVLESNERARRFYEHAGWASDAIVKTDALFGFELREVRYSRMLTATFEPR